MATQPQSSNRPDLVMMASWTGINQSAPRTVIDDQECWWMENFFPTAPGNLHSGWGPSAPLYTAPGGVTILRIFFTSINGTDPLGFMFLSNGNVDQVDLNTQAVTGLGQVWQPVAPDYPADLKLWQPNQYGATAGQGGGLVIGSPLGLYAWDGATLTAPGQTAPSWLAGGSSTPMPVGLPGIYAIEVYKERLWVAGQTVISFSGPGNGADFSSAGGGGSFPYKGDQLTMTFTDMHQSAGTLYFFADSLTNAVTDMSLVSGASTQGTVGTIVNWTAQFNLQNVDPQVGQRFMRPVGVWETAFTLWNGSGIYIMAGSQAVWQSAKLANLMATLDPHPFLPTMAAAHIFGTKWMLFNGSFQDPFGVQRSLLVCWSGPQSNYWVVASQNLALTHIGSYEQNSVITPYGTDGSVLVQLFAQPDATLHKSLYSKMFGGNQDFSNPLAIKDWKRVYVEMIDGFVSDATGTTLVGTFSTAGGGIPNGVEQISFSVSHRAFDLVPAPISGKGLYGMLRLDSTSPDFTISRIILTFEERALYGA